MRLNYGKQGCDRVEYDGVALSDVFEIADVDVSPVPSITAVALDVAGRPGQYFASRQVGTRTVTLKLRLDAESRCPLDIFEAWTHVSGLVCKTEPRPMKLGMYTVNAMLTGDVSIEEKATYGEVEATFTCFDPYLYGETHELPISSGGSFDVLGGVEALPVVEATATGAAVKVTNVATGEYVRIPSVTKGTVYRIDMERQRVEKTNKDYVPIDLMSDFFSLPLGPNSLKLEGCTATLSYAERWL